VGTPAVSNGRQFSIRDATLEDEQAILACLLAAFEPYRAAYTVDAFADTVLTPEALERRFDAMKILVATTPAGEVVGTLACGVLGGDEGHLRGMAVRPDWQGSGVASALLAAGETHLKRRGCSRISLDTTKPLQRAARFYTARGYVPSGKVSDFFGMPLTEYVKVLDKIGPA
jgi:GNAT superfamily N-acetyltransferase